MYPVDKHTKATQAMLASLTARVFDIYMLAAKNHKACLYVVQTHKTTVRQL